MATVDPSTDVAGAVQPQAMVIPPAAPGTPVPLEQRVVLYNVSWETYEHLTNEITNTGLRFAYDEGTLEIMSPLERHERLKGLLRQLLEVITEELNISRRSSGSTTWRRKARKRGLEADEAYYLTNEPKVRGKEQVDLSNDPPPDLAIEIENTRSAVDQLGIYAALGVPEIWRFDGENLVILTLQANGQYAEQAASKYFPAIALEKMVEWIAKRNETDEITWIKEFRRWVRENLVEKKPKS
jgi:Uma2 family endonuclease